MQYASVECETSSFHRSFMFILCGYYDESHIILLLYLSGKAVVNKGSLVTVAHVKLTEYLDYYARALSTDS